MDRVVCAIRVSLDWFGARQADLLAAVQCCNQLYLFLPFLGSGSPSPGVQPALPHTGSSSATPLAERRLLGQVSSPCKLDLLFQPENAFSFHPSEQKGALQGAPVLCFPPGHSVSCLQAGALQSLLCFCNQKSSG